MQIVKAVDYLAAQGVIILCEKHNYYGNKEYCHGSGDKQLMGKYDLPVHLSGIADDIINVTGSMSLKQIKGYAYNTAPMREILEIERERKIFRRALKMEKNDFIPRKFTREELRAARERRNAVPDRGTDEEYCKHILEQHEDYTELKERAEICLNR